MSNIISKIQYDEIFGGNPPSVFHSRKLYYKKEDFILSKDQLFVFYQVFRRIAEIFETISLENEDDFKTENFPYMFDFYNNLYGFNGEYIEKVLVSKDANRNNKYNVYVAICKNMQITRGTNSGCYFKIDGKNVNIFIDKEIFMDRDSYEENLFILIVSIFNELTMNIMIEKDPSISSCVFSNEKDEYDPRTYLVISSFANDNDSSLYTCYNLILAQILYYIFENSINNLIEDYYNIFDIKTFIEFGKNIIDNTSGFQFLNFGVELTDIQAVNLFAELLKTLELKH